MKLIDNAHAWYKMFSIQAQLAQGAFLATWATLPAKFQEVLPTEVVFGIAVALVVLGVVGRLVAQPDLHDTPQQ